MPTKPIVAPSQTNSQAANRFLATYHDQHKHPELFPDGRPFTGWQEVPAQKRAAPAFVSDLQQGEWFGSEDPDGRATQSEAERLQSLASAWDCPWLPERQGGAADFWEFNHLRKRITLRYDRVLAYDRREFSRYYAACNTVASQNGWKETMQGQVPRQAIVDILGRPPRDPRIAQAAMAGDPWLLGFIKPWQHTNHQLAALLGLNEHGMPVPVVPTAEPLLRVSEIVDARERGVSLEQVQALIEAASAKAVADAMRLRDIEDVRRRTEESHRPETASERRNRVRREARAQQRGARRTGEAA